jgi:hypothetical protein
MARQMPLGDPLLLSKFKVAGEILPSTRRIKKEAPSVASDQCIELFARKHQPASIRGLCDTRFNVRLRKVVLAHRSE